VLVATLDGSRAGVQGRFEARGVSLASAQRLTQHYIDGYDVVANAKAETNAEKNADKNAAKNTGTAKPAAVTASSPAP
jgi:hypothetical protein